MCCKCRRTGGVFANTHRVSFGVVLYAPSITLRHIACRVCKISLFDTNASLCPHVSNPSASIGMMAFLYMAWREPWIHFMLPQFFLVYFLGSWNIFLALAEMYFIWFKKLIFWSRITPRYLISITRLRSLFKYLITGFLVIESFEKITYLVLLIDTVSLFSFAQVASMCRQSLASPDNLLRQ